MTKRLKTLFLLIPFFLSACSSVDISKVSKTKWEPSFILGTELSHSPRAEGVRPFLEFKGKTLHGIAGDNIFSCGFICDSDGNVRVSNLSSTKIAGLNNKYEKAFLSAIKNTKYLRYEGEGLYFCAEDDTLLMQLEPFKENPEMAKKLRDAVAPVAPVVAVSIADDTVDSIVIEEVVVEEEATQEELDDAEFLKTEAAAAAFVEAEIEADKAEKAQAQAEQEAADEAVFLQSEEAAVAALALEAQESQEAQALKEAQEAQERAEQEAQAKAEQEAREAARPRVKAQKAASIDDIF